MAVDLDKNISEYILQHKSYMPLQYRVGFPHEAMKLLAPWWRCLYFTDQ